MCTHFFAFPLHDMYYLIIAQVYFITYLTLLPTLPIITCDAVLVPARLFKSQLPA
jgi:hypothetical protein